MNKFQDWLKSRDGSLVEEISAEEMEKHGLDALRYAHTTVEKQRQEKEKAQAIQDLQKITTSLPSWVGDDEDMALKVKAIAAVLHLQDNQEDWVGDMSFGTMLPQSVVEGMAKIKDLDSMAKYFSHENIVRHLGGGNTLHDLASLLKTDFKREIMPLVKKRPDISGDHGEMGRHFSEFVVSHLNHAAKSLLQKLRGEPVGEKNEPEAPKPPVPQPPPAPPSGISPALGN